ncbi:MAG: nucleotidyltransferase family protein [Phycisphaerae bacterium]|nr:nucleotidyltransferase family protein [Phycisphaerae bacterium]
MSREEILKNLESFQPEVKNRFHAELKGIFGSYARNENSQASDIDILVQFHEGASLFDFVALSDFLEEELHNKVDIVPIDTIREELKNRILKEAIYL